MMITNQKKMAAQILSRKEGREVGIHRVWIDPDYLDEVTNAFPIRCSPRSMDIL